MAINNLKDLESVLNKEIYNLMEISPAYLNECGKAALEAYKAANWHCGFCETLEDLANMPEFQELCNIPGKHPEYYNVIRKINRVVQH